VFYQEKGVKLAEENISNRQKVTGPDITSMIFKKGFPILAGRVRGPSRLPIF
jgi:hypothetical protein